MKIFFLRPMKVTSEVEHHFYQIRVKSTVGGAAATFEIYYNFVNDRGSAFL